MITMYGQLGVINIYGVQEFLNTVNVKKIQTGAVENFPYITGPLTFNMSGNNPHVNLKNKVYNLSDNLKFNVDECLGNIDINDALIKMAEDYCHCESFDVVLVGENLLIYHKPLMLIDGTNYQIISEGYHKVVSIPFKGSGVKGVSRVKATRLAKKMYPNAEIDGDCLYIC